MDLSAALSKSTQTPLVTPQHHNNELDASVQPTPLQATAVNDFISPVARDRNW